MRCIPLPYHPHLAPPLLSATVVVPNKITTTTKGHTVCSRELGHLDVVGLVAAVLLASTGIALVAEDGASGHPAGLCIAAAAHRDHRGLLGCAAIVSCCSCSTGIYNLGFVVLLPHSSTTGRPSIVAAYTAGPTAAPRRPPTPLQVIGLRPRSRSRSPTG